MSITLTALTLASATAFAGIATPGIERAHAAPSAATLVSVGQAKAEAHYKEQDVIKLVLDTRGDDVHVTNNGERVTIFVDGEKKWTMGPNDGEKQFYKIVNKEGETLGMLYREGRSIEFSSDVNRVYKRWTQDQHEHEADSIFEARQAQSSQPPVMIGITMTSPVPEHLLEGTGLSGREVTYISEVIEGLPAEKAGLRGGDVIVKVDDADSGDADTLRAVLKTKSPGDTLKVTVLREGDRKEFLLGLKAFDDEALSGGENRARVEVRELDARNRALVAEIEELEEKLAELGEKMSETTDPRKLQEYGTKMGRYGARIGQLSAKLAMEERRHSRVIEELRALESIEAPEPPRVVIPRFVEGEEIEGGLRFLFAPESGEDGFAEMREFMERLAERTTRTDEQMEAYQQRLESLMEKLAESGGEVRGFRFEGDRSIDERLDKFDERLGRLEGMIEKLLESRENRH